MVQVFTCKFITSVKIDFLYWLSGFVIFLQFSAFSCSILLVFPLLRYGEGWDFGEVANNGRGINASQFNISGSGIGR